MKSWQYKNCLLSTKVYNKWGPTWQHHAAGDSNILWFIKCACEGTQALHWGTVALHASTAYHRLYSGKKILNSHLYTLQFTWRNPFISSIILNFCKIQTLPNFGQKTACFLTLHNSLCKTLIQTWKARNSPHAAYLLLLREKKGITSIKISFAAKSKCTNKWCLTRCITWMQR